MIPTYIYITWTLHFVFITTLCHSFVGTSVIFTYIWHITLFGACMAVSGYAERQNRHALTCRVVVPKSLSSKSNIYIYPLYVCSITIQTGLW